jgi:hypothetical protein
MGARLFPRLALAAMLLAQSAVVAMFLVVCVRAQRIPWSIDYGDALVLDETLRLASGENIYPATITRPPYVIGNYPPLFPAIQVPFALLFGPAYWYGRLISELSAVAAAMLVGAVVWRLTKDRLGALAAGTLTIGAPILGMWAQNNRIDLLALALGLAGVYAIVRTQSSCAIVVAAAFIIAAGFTRQTSWIAPAAAACGWLVALGRREAATRLMLYVAIGAVLIALALQLVTHGFLWHVVLVHGDPWSWAHFATGLDRMGRGIPALLLLATVGIAVLRRNAAMALALGYLAGAILVAFSAAKIGAFWNYFIEFAVACALIAGVLLASVSERRFVRAVLLLVVALQGVQSIRAYRLFEPIVGADVSAVLQEMRATHGPVISDEDIGLIPLSGHRLYIEPFKMGLMADTGRWDDSPFLHDVREGRVALAVFRREADGRHPRERFTTRMVGAIEGSLKLCRTIPIGRGATALLYRPACTP